MRADVTAVIMAGGAGRRLGGVVKNLLVIDGHTIFARQHALLAARVGAVWISAREPVPWAPVPVVQDARPGGGPMVGVEASMRAAFATPACHWLLAVAGDMPDVVPGLIDLLLASATADVDIVIPVIGGYAEPLLACYGRACRPHLTALLDAGALRLGALAETPGLRRRVLDEAAVRAVDPTLASLRNINAPGD